MRESKTIGKGFIRMLLIVPIFVFLLTGIASALSHNWNWLSFGEGSGQAGAQFGWSVSTAGDVNGDGYSDIIVGAKDYDNGESNEGKAFVYHGSASGLSTTADWTAEGESGDHLGFSVGTAGDVNGDGYSDVIVGAYYHDNGRGRVFVYYGSSSGLSTSPDWTAEGEPGDYLGNSVGTAGDVNGDGYSDVIVGAYWSGRVFVYYGSSSGLSTTADWTAQCDQITRSLFGVSVGTAGDVNGDGYSDVIIGAEHYGSGTWKEGKVFVYYGSSTGLSTTADWTVMGDQVNAGFGYSVGTAGDVNGDGYSDVIVGAYTYSNVEFQEGKAFVYYGSSSGLSTTADWTAESNHEGDYFGYSVSTAQDVNGDGYSDIIIGGLYGDGRAFVYYGSVSGLGASPDWSANRSYLWFGFSVNTAGDVNGDTYSDIIVGAPGFCMVECNKGAAFVYHGSADPTIAYSPTSFNFTAIEGGSNPSNQTLSIWNSGGGTLTWSVSNNATSWLSLNPTSGTDSGTVTVSVSIAGLTSGTYNATVTITATGATNSPVSIPVTLTVNAPPTIGYSPTSFSFTATQGGSNPSNQTLSIWKAGGGILNWTVSDNATTWLSLNPTSGTNSGTVTISVNITGLTAGTYNAAITITATDATNSPVIIPVTLTINTPVECNLVPDATSIPRGGTLGLQATVTNNTDEVQVFKFATRITKPSGGKYPPTGYLKGPVTVTLGPHDSISRNLTQYVPNNAPLGTYTYHGYVGVPGNIYDECQFQFTVTQ